MSKSGQSLSFKYNAAGLRTEKTENGVTTTYRWVGDKVTQEKNGTDTILYSYDSQGKLVSFNLNGTEHYYVRNGQGDITGILNGAGTQVVTYVYDSWGKLISTTGTLASTVGLKNPYRYRGYRYDTETGLYYLQSRYYNPDWGRFLNGDGILGEIGTPLIHNVYAYCSNNPINRFDPNGDSWWVVGVAVAGAVVGGIWGAVHSYQQSGSVDWRYVVGGAAAGALIGAGLGYASEHAFAAIVGPASSASPVPPASLSGGASNFSVYRGVTQGITKYVGITNNIARRTAEHGERFEFLKPIADNLTRLQARAIEQAFIENFTGLTNQINSIAVKNPIYPQAVKWGAEWLKYHGHIK